MFTRDERISWSTSRLVRKLMWNSSNLLIVRQILRSKVYLKMFKMPFLIIDYPSQACIYLYQSKSILLIWNEYKTREDGEKYFSSSLWHTAFSKQRRMFNLLLYIENQFTKRFEKPNTLHKTHLIYDGIFFFTH